VACPRAYTMSRISCSRRLSVGLARAIRPSGLPARNILPKEMLKNQHFVEKTTPADVWPCTQLNRLVRPPSSTNTPAVNVIYLQKRESRETTPPAARLLPHSDVYAGDDRWSSAAAVHGSGARGPNRAHTRLRQRAVR